jgi:hypothetical protein
VRAIITKQDIAPIPTYRKSREEYIQKMIHYKKDRRVKLAENISLLFENKNTVLFQIQELINSEDLTDPNEIEEYIEIYSGMLPGDNELSATLFIEMDNQQKLEELLVKLKGIEHYLVLNVYGETIPAVFEEVHDDREFTTSVHYLKFSLTQTAKQYILDNSPKSGNIRLQLNHPNLQSEVVLSPGHIASIQQDLNE